MSKLHVINGSAPSDTAKQRVIDRLKKAPKPAALLECPRCAGHSVIETKTGMTLKNGKPCGGTKQLICALCALKGERVVVR